jgi:2-polyprenyl-3-methyl-5-hydroxy-6-metoxy-1,4-benzoquinol methylase
MNQKLNYLYRSIVHYLKPTTCPNCGRTADQLVDRKFYFTRLLKCAHCHLSVRYPTDSAEFLAKFYQSDYDACYSDETLSITSLPSDEELAQLVKDNFPDKRNHAPFVKALTKTTSAKVLDYGCSWGYSVHHLKQAGFDAEGFEISRPRAEFGKKINVTIHSSHENVAGGLDLIMSNHAIEHLPVISDFIKFCASKLKKDGIFVAFCPNGSNEYRMREPEIFHVNWGFLHPNYLDIEFATKAFKENPYFVLTGDWNYDTTTLSSWDGNSQVVGEKRDGKELLIIAKPNVKV